MTNKSIADAALGGPTPAQQSTVTTGVRIRGDEMTLNHVSYAEQQSQAVAVPLGYVQPYVTEKGLDGFTATLNPTSEGKYTVPVWAAQSPRISEQESFEIILSFYGFMESFKIKNGRNPSVIEWYEADGRAMLNKLNGAKNHG